MKVTDRVVLRTLDWTIESDNDTYHIQCQEDYTQDYWYLSSEEEGSIDEHSDLGQSLIKVCEDYEKEVSLKLASLK